MPLTSAASQSPARHPVGSRRLAWCLLWVIIGLAALFPWWPLTSDQRWGVYCASETAAITLAWLITARRHAPVAWWLLLGGVTLNVIADLLYYRETVIIGMGAEASFSDVVYLAAYLPLAAGLVMLGRRVGRSTGALLDASIFAVGLAVPVVAFHILPAAHATGFGVDGLMLLGIYALGSILMFALFIHQVTARRGHNPAFLVLGFALLMGAIGDSLWNLEMMGTSSKAGELPKMLWFLSRSLPLVVILHPAAQQIWDYEAVSPTSPVPRLRLVALTLGLLMPAATLLLSLLAQSPHPYWIAVAGGGVLLPVLVLMRMDGLLLQLRTQARQLDTLSHFDDLTGAPNRRQWKRAVAEAATHARSNGTVPTMALLDLDHFKEFNDANGHHDGDDLLREAYAAWSALLPPGCLLSRYGGEEFALLIPRGGTLQAVQLLTAMQQVTPRGQTFSAGVTPWDPATEPDIALDRADALLYQAKQAGRNRVQLANPADDPRH